MAAAESSTALCFLLLLGLSHAVTFEIVNDCPYTVWAAAVPGGGTQLNQGQSWIINVNPGTTGRIWARTGCSFDGSGRGRCLTGDCGGLLKCQGYGNPPETLAEFALNQFNSLDFFDISNVDGFNVPMDFSPSNGSCLGVRCAADIVGQCPAALRMPRGCSNPCTALKTDEYCCTTGSYSPNTGISMEINIRVELIVGGEIPRPQPGPVGCAAGIAGQCPGVLTAAPAGCYNPCTIFKTDEYCCNSGACKPTDYSRFFKNLCPDAYSYPKDDATSTFTCPGGTNYRVTFCP